MAIRFRKAARPFTLLIQCLVLAALTSGAGQAQTYDPTQLNDASLTRRLFFSSHNLLTQSEQLEDLLYVAAEHGYNGVVLNDVKLQMYWLNNPTYEANVRRVAATARSLGMDVIAPAAPFGYSETILRADANLAAEMPVRDALFEVRSGRAAPITELDSDPLPGGDFESWSGDAARGGWWFQDSIGNRTRRDNSVKHSGGSSLRMQYPAGNLRIAKQLKLKPFRMYRMTAWVKTEGFTAAGAVALRTIANDNGQILTYNPTGVKANQGWTRHDVVFNSLSYEDVNFYFGVWGSGSGRMWVDDISIEEIGFLNLLRRSRCPLVVRGEGGQVYTEGVDYQRLEDPLGGAGTFPNVFSSYHDQPVLRVKSGSGISEGQRLRISYFHTMPVYGWQTTAALTDPAVFDVIEDQMRYSERLLSPDGWHLGFDEIRIGNWCDECLANGWTAGETIAQAVSDTLERLDRVAPGAQIYVWSDMFDPHHNATAVHHTLNGTAEGSWVTLPASTIVLNWNHRSPSKSVTWFKSLGMEQVSAGYYDRDPLPSLEWIIDAQTAQPDALTGFMYTTWVNGYGRMDDFAKLIWGAPVAVESEPPARLSPARARTMR